MAIDITKELAALGPEMVALRRDLHRHPELAFNEVRTAGIIAKRLRELGMEPREGLAKTGVVATLRGRSGGKTVAIRADMDALPIAEETSLEFKSEVPGAMHACGHDGHVAAALTVARLLSAHRNDFRGDVKFIFQPAEETASGAEAMIADGAMRDPKPDAVFGVHLWNTLPVGVVGLREGSLWASADDIQIVVRGRGGHGAMPHLAIDPIPVAAHIILALENLVAREASPFEPVVLTVGSIHGGSAFNVIPGAVTMAGTLRAFSMDVRDAVVQRIEETVQGICRAMRCEGEVHARFCCPPVVNDPGMTALARTTATRALGGQRVIETQRSTAGDDVSYFQNMVPGCYMLVGSANAERGQNKSHHHPQFDFDEAALPVAAELLAGCALEFLERA